MPTSSWTLGSSECLQTSTRHALLSSLPFASSEAARLPLMEEAGISASIQGASVGRRSSLQAARYVVHGYDMAETGSRAVCLCASAELSFKLPEPSRWLSTYFVLVCMPGLLQAKNPRATGTHLTRSPSATAPPPTPGAWCSRRGCSLAVLEFVGLVVPCSRC